MSEHGLPPEELAALAGAYRAQLETYRVLHRRVQEYRDRLVAGEELPGLEGLEEQGRLVREIEGLQRRAGQAQERLARQLGVPRLSLPVLEEWAADPAHPARPALAELRALVDELEQLVRQVRALADENLTRLQEQARQLGTSILELQRGRSARRAYRREERPSGEPPRFIDERR